LIVLFVGNITFAQDSVQFAGDGIEAEAELDYSLFDSFNLSAFPANNQTSFECGSSAPFGLEVKHCFPLNYGASDITWTGKYLIRKPLAWDPTKSSELVLNVRATVQSMSIYTTTINGEGLLAREVLLRVEEVNSNGQSLRRLAEGKYSCNIGKGVNANFAPQDPNQNSDGSVGAT